MQQTGNRARISKHRVEWLELRMWDKLLRSRCRIPEVAPHMSALNSGAATNLEPTFQTRTSRMMTELSHLSSTFCVFDDAVALELAILWACGTENAVSEIRFALTPPLPQSPPSLWMEPQCNKLVVDEGETNIVRRTISSNLHLWPGFRSHHSRKSPRCPTTKTLLAAPRGLKCGG